MQIKIIDVIGVSFAITKDQGTKVYDQIKPYIGKESITLDYDGVPVLANEYLNALYGRISLEASQDTANSIHNLHVAKGHDTKIKLAIEVANYRLSPEETYRAIFDDIDSEV